MKQGESKLKSIERAVHELFCASGLNPAEAVHVSLGVARASALNVDIHGVINLWTHVFSRLVQCSSVGRPDLGGMLDKSELSVEADLSLYRIDKLDELGRLLSLETNQGRMYPRFQVWRGSLLPGVTDVNSILASEELSMETRALFYMWPLFGGANVLEALRAGRVDVVVDFAPCFRGFFI
ncbi:hypothetical protein [Pelagicoccus sp. SDUM812003]|uniref:hypothetical protein n=1 Tax=Pelagicoccus sp. SDUM812003 TaxID=3041267 RepID=UPI00280F5C29|nr:hypothetical protein [Pelagicoccus sp. SDUM812003]MDQ8201480.1 hypothetical protein [Pelagicoccus sp. SDUM812003]